MTRQKKTSSKHGTDWEPCPQGSFSSLSRRLRARRQRRRVLQASLVGGAALLTTGGLWALLNRGTEREQPGPPRLAGLTCQECVELAKDFRRGTLEPRKSQQVRQHVRLCPHCKPRYEKMGIEV